MLNLASYVSLLSQYPLMISECYAQGEGVFKYLACMSSTLCPGHLSEKASFQISGYYKVPLVSTSCLLRVSHFLTNISSNIFQPEMNGAFFLTRSSQGCVHARTVFQMSRNVGTFQISLQSYCSPRFPFKFLVRLLFAATEIIVLGCCKFTSRLVLFQ